MDGTGKPIFLMKLLRMPSGKGDVLGKNSFCSVMTPFAALFFQGQSRWKVRAFLIGFVLTTLGIGSMFSPIGQPALAQSGKKKAPSSGEVDAQRLIGRWVRPDGGYILELREAHEGGGLKAAYFNPRPIRVSEAVWSRQNGKISVWVELQDVNYPGSTYRLEYIPETDRLKGTYFQAVDRQTYDIEFMRAK
jgi:hypothetical protein